MPCRRAADLVHINGFSTEIKRPIFVRFQDMKFQMDSQIRKLDNPVSLPSGDDALKSELEDLKKQVRAMISGSHDCIKIHKDSV